MWAGIKGGGLLVETPNVFRRRERWGSAPMLGLERGFSCPFDHVRSVRPRTADGALALGASTAHRMPSLDAPLRNLAAVRPIELKHWRRSDGVSLCWLHPRRRSDKSRSASRNTTTCPKELFAYLQAPRFRRLAGSDEYYGVLAEESQSERCSDLRGRA